MLQVKICSGLQDGAIITSDDSELVIGSRENCNLFLLLEDYSDFFCKLNVVDPNTLRLTDLSNCVVSLANGEKISLNQDFSINKSLQINGIKLIIGNNLDDKDWGFDIIDDEPPAVDIEEDIVISADDTDLDFDLSEDVADDFASKIADNVPSNPSNLKDIEKKSKHNVSKIKIPQRVKKYLWMLGLMLILVAGAIGYIVFTYSNNKLVHTESISQVDSLTKQLDSLPDKYSNLTLSSNNGVISIGGIVETVADLDYIKRYFKDFKSLNIVYKIITFDQAKSVITNILDKYNLKDIVVSYDDSQGGVDLTGIISNYDKLSDAEIDINNSLPNGVNVNTNSVYDANMVTKDFQSTINFLGSDQLSVKYDFSVPSISLTGYLDDGTLDELKLKIDDFKNRYPVIVVNLDISKLDQVLPFKISMIYSGKPSYVITDAGEKIFVGGTVGGLTLVSVDDTKVQFMGKYPIVVNLQDIQSWGNTDDQSNGRDKILNQEFNKTKDAIAKEQDQLKRIQKLLSTIKESDVIKELNAEAKNITDDITLKQHELNTYGK